LACAVGSSFAGGPATGSNGAPDGGNRRPAMLVFDRKVSLTAPAYFVALSFKGDHVVAIHDFLFARYAMDGIDLQSHEAAGLISS
jgi:hypothetical protein